MTETSLRSQGCYIPPTSRLPLTDAIGVMANARILSMPTNEASRHPDHDWPRGPRRIHSDVSSGRITGQRRP
jgi:hypothetical protein